MILIIYACDKNELSNILLARKLPRGNHLDKYNSVNSQKVFCTIALSDYIKPNPNKSYIILNNNVIKNAKYWAPRWNSVYTSDKYWYYYNKNKSIKYNLNRWVSVYEDTLTDYNTNFTYNEIGIPQNEIVFDEPIDLNVYGEWVIF
jgi:hypothetical protein